MYLYLYDYFLNDHRYHRTLAKIEIRLTDLGISGKITRLSPLKNLKALLEDEVRNGVKTVIAVGNDKTLLEMVNNIAEYNDITVGMIPIGPNNKIAKDLGIPGEEAACDIISARKLEKLDLGRANNTYFLSGLTIEPDSRVTLQCDKSYQITSRHSDVEVSICNLRPTLASPNGGRGRHFNPCDGYLEALFGSRVPQWFQRGPRVSESIFPFKKITIVSHKSVSVKTDSDKILKTPIEVTVMPQKLKMIVGKERVF